MRKLRYFLSGRLFPCALLLGLTLGAGIALSVWLPRALAPIAAFERLFSLGVGIYVVRSASLPDTKHAKLLLLLLLPWTGAFFCLILKTQHHARFLQVPDLRSSSLDPFSRLSVALGGFPATNATSIRYFPDGREMYRAFLADLEAAKERIWLEYFIVAEGTLLREVKAVLAEKVRENVDVRLIYDDFGCCLTLPASYAKTLEKAGIRAATYGKLRFGARMHRRDHRKIAVIDGAAYTGGINLADEYIGEKIRFGHWKDTAVRVTGGAADDLARLFSGTWNTLRPHDRVTPKMHEWGEKMPCLVFGDDARDNAARTGVRVISRLISGAERCIYVNTPYLALDKTLKGLFETAALCGVDVRIMIPHIPDKKSVFLLTRRYAREMMRSGVKVREYTAGFLHAKSIAVDGRRAIVSSYNLDFRSLYLQGECGLLAEDEAFAADVTQDFLHAWEEGSEVPRPTWRDKFFSPILRFFAPLL